MTIKEFLNGGVNYNGDTIIIVESNKWEEEKAYEPSLDNEKVISYSINGLEEIILEVA